MITPELREWLDNGNAEELLSPYRQTPRPIPEGWHREEQYVEHYGGEDEGRDYWTIWRFNHVNGDSILIRVNGWYASYEGAEYNNYEEVVPVSKTVTVYEKA